MTARVVVPVVEAITSTVVGTALVDATTFAVLVWGTLALVVAVFVYLLYGVLRAGGVDLTDDGH